MQKLRPVVLRTNEHGVPVTNSYVNLKRKVSVEQWQQITQAMDSLVIAEPGRKLKPAEKTFNRGLRQSAIYAADHQQRSYPSQSLAAHVIGFALEEEKEFNNLAVTKITGADGEVVELLLLLEREADDVGRKDRKSTRLNSSHG